MERETILLAEYAEAGNVCRAHEQHTRAIVAAYLAFATAILAIVFSIAMHNLGRISLCFLGFCVGVFVAIAVLRSRAYYSSFVGRAKEIEAELGMRLYSNAWPLVESTGTFSSKQAFFGLIGALATFFLVASIVFAIFGSRP